MLIPFATKLLINLKEKLQAWDQTTVASVTAEVENHQDLLFGFFPLLLNVALASEVLWDAHTVNMLSNISAPSTVILKVWGEPHW